MVRCIPCCLILSSLLFFAVCSENQASEMLMPQNGDAAARELIQHFFDAFDARDYDLMEAAFTPDATVIHNNGVMTSVPELLEIIRTTKAWPPRQRALSEFRIRWVGDVAIVKVHNDVTFELQSRSPLTNNYHETWVLQRTDSGLKALHVHYAKVTATRHSEEVE